MKEKGNILIILIMLAILAAGVLLYYKTKLPKLSISQPSQKISTNSTEKIKTYRSENLKFILQIPDQWQVVEGRAFIDLISTDGKINISKIATNFEDLKGYTSNFDSKRKLDIKEEENLIISDYPVLKRIEILEGGSILQQKVYYILIDNLVYSLSTTSEALFDDLDQIAKTFRYIP